MLAFLLVFLNVSAKAQVTHRVSNAEENSLKTFIENTAGWAPGDIIVLESAGEYIVRGGIEIKQNVTIMGDEALAQNPRVTLYGGAFMPRANNLDITLKGFDVNGLTMNAENKPQRAAVLQFSGRNAGGEFSGGNFTIEDMYATGLSTGVELFYDSGLRYESLKINNVFWNDISGWVVDPRLNATDRIEITNSTFSNFGGFFKNPYNVDAGKGRTEQYPMVIVIDHNTFYNGLSAVGGADALIQINDPKENQITFTFTNNIVSTLTNSETTRPFRINAAAGTFTFSNNLFHNFNSARDAGAHNIEAVATAQENVTLTNPVTGEPGFLNPAAGNFSLASNSPLLTAGTENSALGDPSWSDEDAVYTIHRISNTEENSLKTFIENTAGWSPGDIIVLESAGEYIVRGGIEIKQNVTIMGDEALAQNPRVTLYGGAFMPRANNLDITLKGFDVNGLTMNAENKPQRAAVLQFSGRNAGGEFSGGNFTIEDMYATGLSTGVELFYDSGLRYESLKINNVFWNDISGWVVDPRLNATDRIEITNSTFSNFGGFFKNPYNVDAGKGRTEQYPMVIVIDHNTFYNGLSAVGGADALIQINDPKENQITFTFTNNIVSTLTNSETTRPFRINAAAGTFTFSNNLFHNFNSARDAGAHNIEAVATAQANVTLTNPVEGEPGFLTPGEGDFTLPEGTALLTAGTNGGLIGAPRWAPENTTSADPELAAAKIEVYPNPVRDVLHINSPSVVEVTIYNIAGSVVMTGKIDRVGSINIANLKSGLYIARINSGSKVQSVKLIKE